MGLFGFGRTRVFLARHGEIDGARELCLSGHTDKRLTEKGHTQSRALAERLASEKIKAVYSSDLTRTRVAGELIAEKHGLTNQVVPAIKEMSFGEFEGLTYMEAVKKYREQTGESQVTIQKIFFEGFPGGETLETLQTRVVPAFQEIVERHAGESIAVVAHGGVNRAILLWALHLPVEQFLVFEQDHGCLNILDFYGKTMTIRLLNAR